MGSTQSRVVGAVLIVIVGLLNFHIPHFLLERRSGTRSDGFGIELVFLANVIAAVVAGVGIWRDRRWGWLLGITVTGLAFGLYLLQESVGLPGLPQNWLEPSRLLALALEALFVWLAGTHLKRLGHAPVAP